MCRRCTCRPSQVPQIRIRQRHGRSATPPPPPPPPPYTRKHPPVLKKGQLARLAWPRHALVHKQGDVHEGHLPLILTMLLHPLPVQPRKQLRNRGREDKVDGLVSGRDECGGPTNLQWWVPKGANTVGVPCDSRMRNCPSRGAASPPIRTSVPLLTGQLGCKVIARLRQERQNV